ncbi:hypothetical protein M8C21_009845 [Ambrosia artemisiifolia]|uniref:Uncharacterized protein n=1 Tax=Ambrosia artemisiifolia TaxID=4212 RepID=A0AAD5G2R9_AMBAR|nr:hypothetical protein M8C21_009845 [Ambrosia artemisiifolia]
MAKPFVGDKTMAFTSSLLEGEVQSSTRSDLIDQAMEEIYDERYGSGDEKFDNFISSFSENAISDLYPHEQKDSEGMSKAFVSDEITESNSSPPGEILKSVLTHEVIGDPKKVSQRFFYAPSILTLHLSRFTSQCVIERSLFDHRAMF